MPDHDRRGCLIAIAGGIGSGKSTIAAAVSQRLSIPVHSIDDDKRAIGATHPDFDHWVTEAIPFPDEFRRQVYDHTLGSLRELARRQPRAIVEETFHRAHLREPFFSEASALFGGLCLIEVVVSPPVAVAHLQKRAHDESDHMAGQAMYDAFVELADPILGADLVVDNDGDLEVAVTKVCAHVEQLACRS